MHELKCSPQSVSDTDDQNGGNCASNWARSGAIWQSFLRGDFRCGTSLRLGAWRSLVAHLPWEQGVGRSNRLAPIKRASSSGGQSNGLLSRGSGVRVPSGAPWSRGLGRLIAKRTRGGETTESEVSVAQLAEHRIVAPVVEGSNPFTHPTHPATKTCFDGGPLAQLVEQLTLNQRVRSSSLRRPTKRRSPSQTRLISHSKATGNCRLFRSAKSPL